MMDNNLKRCREELEMTQTELGYVFGVQKATMPPPHTPQPPTITPITKHT